MTLEELQETLERIMPDDYGFDVYTYKKDDTIYVQLNISKHGRDVHTSTEDSIYYALLFVTNYFKSLTEY